MARIFLCPAREDKAQVREVYHRLRAIDEFDPWLDEEDLLPGQEWAREIPRALQASDFLRKTQEDRGKSMSREGRAGQT